MIIYEVEVYGSGTKFWYLNGKRHRKDGPAVEYADGTAEWYIDGDELTEKEFNSRMNPCTPEIITVDGVTYRRDA